LPLTIGQTIEQLHGALRDYIEAAYHVSNPVLVEQRRKVLERVGTIHQTPYIESTPRYEIGTAFESIAGLDQAVTEIFGALSSSSDGLPVVIHDPPFDHQAESVRQSLVNDKSLIVMTGTGSGKTECFLLPILGKLALEAKNRPASFRQNKAVRAIVLYPMNALVNDQLGRLRLLFSDSRLVKKFIAWSGRPATFARYTSRTLYPGVRTAKKDQQRLTSLADYYVHHLETSLGPASQQQLAAQNLVHELMKRGKWPAKPDLMGWFGKTGTRWQDPKTGAFRRCVTLPQDPELLTRHEVQEAPPDVLVTNYSMLEYMLMRPIERPVFERTREWLEQNPHENFILVVDEAHLYRGASGAEVALLIRRLRKRLGVPSSRLQVICTSASFGDPSQSAEFAAQLTGKEASEFVTVEGNLAFRDHALGGTQADAEALASVNIDSFYAATDDSRLNELLPFLRYRAVSNILNAEQSLYEALHNFAPLSLLVNITMKEARPFHLLSADIFPGVEPDLAGTALTSLMALGSVARKSPNEPGLLPCRIHAFYKGLPGLWVCMDAECSELATREKGGPIGKLYAQPLDSCPCGARVLELFTCRNCGTAYARAYTDSVSEPSFLWAEPGSVFRTFHGQVQELEPIDLLLEEPSSGEVEPADFDLVTGRLNPAHSGSRTRRVYLSKDRSVESSPTTDDEPAKDRRPGEFRPCGVCNQTASFGRTSVQDHQTKGDQPFQALIAKQLQVQPPNAIAATRLAPLRGRKVLIFSDSRQTAARLAPNLQRYSTQDAIRPIIIYGFSRLQGLDSLRDHLCLEDLYFAVLLGANELGVRLRPALKTGEHFGEESIIEQAVQKNVLGDPSALLSLYIKMRSSLMPEALLSAVYDSLLDRYYGLESLALASGMERPLHATAIIDLPDIPDVADSVEKKLALTRVWLRYWQWNRNGFWLEKMPAAWSMTRVRPHASGKFTGLRNVLVEKGWRQIFDRNWLPRLLQLFTEPLPGNQFRLKGGEITLQIGGKWAYCKVCRSR
jgi:DEAD/DEAH box helicase